MRKPHQRQQETPPPLEPIPDKADEEAARIQAEDELLALAPVSTKRPIRKTRENYTSKRKRAAQEIAAIEHAEKKLEDMRKHTPLVGYLGAREVRLTNKSAKLLNTKSIDKSNSNGVPDDVHLRAVQNIHTAWKSRGLEYGPELSDRPSEIGKVDYLKPTGVYYDEETNTTYNVKFTVRMPRQEKNLCLYSIELFSRK